MPVEHVGQYIEGIGKVVTYIPAYNEGQRDYARIINPAGKVEWRYADTLEVPEFIRSRET